MTEYVVVCNDVYNGEFTKVMGVYTSKAKASKVENEVMEETKPTKENGYSGEDLKYFIQKIVLNK